MQSLGSGPVVLCPLAIELILASKSSILLCSDNASIGKGHCNVLGGRGSQRCTTTRRGLSMLPY